MEGASAAFVEEKSWGKKLGASANQILQSLHAMVTSVLLRKI